MTIPEPVSLVDNVLAGINALCEVYATAQTARVEARHAVDKTEYDQCVTRGEYWDAAVSTQYQALVNTLDEAISEPLAVESFVPVRALPNGQVEIHARDQTQRRLVLRLSSAQAIAIGVHLSAYAAIGLDRAGQRLAGFLPTVDPGLVGAVILPDPAPGADPGSTPPR